MVFSSPNFLFLFMPLALVICLLAQGRWFLVAVCAVSFFFYYWSSGPYILVLIAVAALSYFGALRLGQLKREASRKRAVALFSVLILSFLFFFKYAGFVTANVDVASGTNLAHLFGSVPLPIGISFFTFQALSYLIDVYRGVIPAERKAITLGGYLMFFPHLVAGPIVRYRDVVDDFHDPKISAGNFAAGVTRFAHGLAKKVIIADAIAPIVDAVFALPPGEAHLFTAWFGAAAYGLQIYFDFSGYSDMAIGLALMLGIRFRENFERPYVSCSITEFWRRWHISLSSWFRDYLYIPLGGNREGPVITCRNLLIVFVVTGLWHGAAWTFLVWGLFHGTFLLVERLAFREPLQALSNPALRYLYALPAVVLGWVVFRADSLSQALWLWSAMLRPFAQGAFDVSQVADLTTPASIAAFLLGASIFVVPGKVSLGSRLMHASLQGWSAWLNTGYAVSALGVTGLIALTGSYSPFLYFRF
jgi:alginate O-acetyltransferase complex protein AlgI